MEIELASLLAVFYFFISLDGILRELPAPQLFRSLYRQRSAVYIYKRKYLLLEHI